MRLTSGECRDRAIVGHAQADAEPDQRRAEMFRHMALALDVIANRAETREDASKAIIIIIEREPQARGPLGRTGRHVST